MKVALPKGGMNYQNSKEALLSRAGPDYTQEALDRFTRVRKPISCMYDGTPDSSNRVRGLDDLSNVLVGEAVSMRRDRSIFPFIVMMPRGPGILSVREA